MANYNVRNGTSVESFETIGDWTAGGTAGGSITVDSTVYTEGTGSLKVTTTSGTSSVYYATKTISRSFATDQTLYVDVYIVDKSTVNNVTIYLTSDSGFTKYFSKAFNSGILRNGWNRMSVNRTQWTNTGSDDWANTMIRLRVRVDAVDNNIAIAYFDNLIAGRYARPKFVFRFDDNRDSQYTTAYPIMRQFGFKGSVFVIKDKVDTAGYMTSAQMQELHNNGWDMCNHTTTHTDLSSQDLPTQTNELSVCSAYLAGRGWTRRNEHLHAVFPYGGYNSDTLLALASSNMLTGGTILSPKSTIYPVDNTQLFTVDNIVQTVNITTALAAVDRAIADGGLTTFLFHIITGTAVASTEWATADFTTLCQYLSKKSPQIDVVTWTECYQGLTSVRKEA